MLVILYLTKAEWDALMLDKKLELRAKALRAWQEAREI